MSDPTQLPPDAAHDAYANVPASGLNSGYGSPTRRRSRSRSHSRSPAGPRRSRSPRRKNQQPVARVYIGNLGWNMKDEDLAALFRPYGEVVDAHVTIDRITGRSRGFGFVTMASPEQAKKASDALDSTEVEGRAIRIDYARPMTADRPPRKSSPPRGGGGGFDRERDRRDAPRHDRRDFPPRDRDRDRERDRGRGLPPMDSRTYDRYPYDRAGGQERGGYDRSLPPYPYPSYDRVGPSSSYDRRGYYDIAFNAASLPSESYGYDKNGYGDSGSRYADRDAGSGGDRGRTAYPPSDRGGFDRMGPSTSLDYSAPAGGPARTSRDYPRGGGGAGYGSTGDRDRDRPRYPGSAY